MSDEAIQPLSLNEDRKVSAPLKLWIALLVATASACYAVTSLRNEVTAATASAADHEARLRVLEQRIERIDANVEFVRRTLEQPARELIDTRRPRQAP